MQQRIKSPNSDKKDIDQDIPKRLLPHIETTNTPCRPMFLQDYAKQYNQIHVAQDTKATAKKANLMIKTIQAQ